MLSAMKPHPASHRDVRAGAAVGGLGGGRRHRHHHRSDDRHRVLAGAPDPLRSLLTALMVAAIAVVGPAPLRTLVYLDMVFLLFVLGTHLQWPPAGTTVLVCVLPLAALLAGDRGSRPRLGRRLDPLVLILAVGTVVGAGAALTLRTVVVAPAAPPYLAQL